MSFSRRETILMALGAAAAMTLPGAARASVEDAIAAFTDGAELSDGGITLTLPEIAENGSSVQVEVSAPDASEILILSTGNPLPRIATFRFGPLAGSQSAITRIRLSGTQEVIALARMPDGSFLQTSQEVLVTVGGCEA